MIGRTIAHYQIVEKIGEGGMGVVYKARDTRLNRLVAVKVLPPEKLADADRRQRFIQEARAASALNHPNIIIVHDVASEEGCDLIVMELVAGKELHRLIGPKGLLLKEALRYGSQIANALAAAHAAGIVHRDLKPGNVMVNEAGLVKVLDFGLAKLAEPAIGVEGSTETILPQTQEGKILGTVAYMSPEQASGKKVDSRSDIFSLGTVLYEMITGRRAFQGENTLSTLAAVVNEDPTPVTKIAQKTPPEAERIVQRCLKKDPDKRFQSAADLRVALEDCLEESETREPTGFRPRRRPSLKAIAIIGLLVLVVAIASLIFLPNWLAGTAGPFERTKITRLTTTGKARLGAISLDGKYLAYAEEDLGAESLWVRQVATGSAVQVLPPAVGQFRKLVFSADGDYLFFVRSPEGRSTADDELYRVPSLGGTPRRVVGGIANLGSPDGRYISLVSISPVGDRVAVVSQGAKGETTLTVINGDGREQRGLAVRKLPETISSVAWSPNGKSLGFGVSIMGGPISGSWFEVPAAGGAARLIASLDGLDYGGEISWFPDGGYQFMTLMNNVRSWHIYRLSRSSGKAQIITNDPSKYVGVSLTADGRTLVSVQSDHICNVWVGDARGADARQITFGTNRYDGFYSISWTPDNELVYGTAAAEIPSVWRVSLDGKNPRQLTTGRSNAPVVSPDGRYVAYIDSDAAGAQRVFRMNADGGNPVKIVETQSYWPEWSADGKWIVYVSYATPQDLIWKVPVDGGTSVQLTNKESSRPAVSADGKWIAYFNETRNVNIEVIPFDGGAPVYTFDTPAPISALSKLHWTPDGKGLAYAATKSGVSNIWIQDFRGGPPKLMTHFAAGLIFNFAWSRDGSMLALARGGINSDVVAITDIK